MDGKEYGIVNCPHCTHKNKIDVNKDPNHSYQFDFSIVCELCELLFMVKPIIEVRYETRRM